MHSKQEKIHRHTSNQRDTDRHKQTEHKTNKINRYRCNTSMLCNVSLGYADS